MRALLFGALLLSACTQGPGDTEDTGPVVIVSGPALQFEPVEGPLLQGEPVPVALAAADEDGVLAVSAYFRTSGEAAWDTLPLEPVDGLWKGEIPGDQVRAPGIEYYFKGTDDSPLRAVSYLPADGLAGPFAADVSVVGQALPFLEDFEGGSHLFALGWAEYSEGFPGYAWALTNSAATSGTTSAVHRRGAQGVSAMVDWMVSPALDLRAYDRVEITWMERGDYAHLGTHSLWATTGDPDPLEGGYELVQELVAPEEDAWSRSPVVDLSAWAGEQAVHLAWRYDGEYADAWFIDDVAVRRLGPDLHLVDVAWTPVDPGGTTTVSLTVENRTLVTAEGLVLTPSVEAALGAFAGPVTVGDLAGGDTATVEVSLAVAADHPDNAELPFAVDAASGDADWHFDAALVVGQPSTAYVALTLSAPGYVNARVGKGDPEAPEVAVPVVAAVLSAGSYSYEIDLTAQGAELPPGPGADRWWLQVESSSGGTVDAFEIAWDDARFASDPLGAVGGDLVRTFWLPPPPEPVVLSSVTTPTSPAPGDDVSWAVRLANAGNPTVGRTTVTLSSTDPDVEIETAAAILLGESGWAGGAVADLALAFRVLPTQDDSRPLLFTLTVADEVEQLEVPVQVAVPWPVLQVTGVRIDDDGDRDGLLDPGESAFLEIDLTNVGGRDSFGTVDCKLSQAGGSATAEILVAGGNFGTLTKGETDDEDAFRVRASGGAAGDPMDLLLTCTDAGYTYRAGFSLALGERPYVSITPTRDPAGDVQKGYGFDFVDGYYRSDGAKLELVLVSDIPYDGGTLFLEAWMSSTGAPYTNYQLVSQSGKLSLRGYRLGVFTKLSEPVLTELDDHRVHIAIELAPMSLALKTINVGFATGFCGGDAYYCDHYPDAWGDPYTHGMITSRWARLTW